MADPSTIAGGLGLAGIGAQLGGLGVSASMISSIQSGYDQAATGARALGQAQSQAYTYQAGVAKLNQQVSAYNEQYSLQMGDTRAMLAGMATRAQLAATRTAQGASGLDVNTGSAKAVQESEINLGNYEEASIRSEAAREAYGYQIEGYNYGAESQLDTMAAQRSVQAGDLQADVYTTQGQTAVLQGTASLLATTGNIANSASSLITSGAGSSIFGAIGSGIGSLFGGGAAAGGIAGLPVEALAIAAI